MSAALVDRLSRLLASTPTRRTLGGGAFGLVAALLGARVPDEAAAHDPTAACRDIAWPPERRACFRWAKRHRKNH
ncbi:MAG TPA: hypothetical protein VHG52_09945, partial [Thermomicrobiales bacterium]|nr:hypothetical protein [Thermomicrobiales bacterium]